MKKLFSPATIVFVLLSIIMSGCVGVPNRAPGASEGGNQSIEEMLSLIKLPVKKVNIFSCAHLRVLYGPKLPVHVSEKYSTTSKKNVGAFFKASTNLFNKVGYEVKIGTLPSSACYDLDSLVGEVDTLTLMVVFFAHENVVGYQKLDVQVSVVPPGIKGRYFSHQTTIGSGWGFSYDSTAAAEKIMEPIIELLSVAKRNQ